jgi:hypothetical protein
MDWWIWVAIGGGFLLCLCCAYWYARRSSREAGDKLFRAGGTAPGNSASTIMNPAFKGTGGVSSGGMGGATPQQSFQHPVPPQAAVQAQILHSYISNLTREQALHASQTAASVAVLSAAASSAVAPQTAAAPGAAMQAYRATTSPHQNPFAKKTQVAKAAQPQKAAPVDDGW